MPDQAAISNIRLDFSRLYKIALDGLDDDIRAIEAPINNISSGMHPNATEIYLSSISTDNASPSLVNDIEQFEFSEETEDNTLRDRLVERNLEIACELLQDCLALRREFNDIAKLYVETRLKSEEFFRLDAIHQLEVAAGLYELPYKEAKREFEAASQTLQAGAAQRDIPHDVFEKSLQEKGWGGVLTQNGIGNPPLGKGRANALAAELAAIPFPRNDRRHSELATAAVHMSDYRFRLEEASWYMTQSANDVAYIWHQAKHDITKEKMEYAQKDIVFRSSRAMVSRQLAWAQLEENTRTNSPINFHERLERMRPLFDIAARQLVKRILALRRGVESLYGINTPELGPPQRGHLLDDLAVWLMHVKNEIDTVALSQKSTLVSINMSELAAKSDIDFMMLRQTQPFDIRFSLEQQDTYSISGLLRGITFEYLGSSNSPISLSVYPPGTVTRNLSDPGGSPDRLILSRIVPVALGLDIRPQHSEATWNGDPYGEWRVVCDRNFANDGIDDLIMYLWVVHQ